MYYPSYRMRRLRRTAAVRDALRETTLQVDHLIQPLFVCAGQNVRQPLPSMPGCYQLSIGNLVAEARELARVGVRAVLLFGIPSHRDSAASGAYDSEGVLQLAVRAVKDEIPDLLVITDVCLCSAMDHGHCGVVQDGEIVNDVTLELLAKTAVTHAESGADIVAPSDMMDGRVRAIRQELDRLGFSETPIMSYAAKFASAFYGPFREAAESAPRFGDRRSYQMDAANAAEALREVALDIEEGADIVMVKPALAYLDIIHRVKTRFGYPTAAYAVSAEHAMIKAAAAQGWIDEQAVTLESLLAMRRAGADILITYAATDVARWLRRK